LDLNFYIRVGEVRPIRSSYRKISHFLCVFPGFENTDHLCLIYKHQPVRIHIVNPLPPPCCLGCQISVCCLLLLISSSPNPQNPQDTMSCPYPFALSTGSTIMTSTPPSPLLQSFPPSGGGNGGLRSLTYNHNNNVLATSYGNTIELLHSGSGVSLETINNAPPSPAVKL